MQAEHVPVHARQQIFSVGRNHGILFRGSGRNRSLHAERPGQPAANDGPGRKINRYRTSGCHTSGKQEECREIRAVAMGAKVETNIRHLICKDSASRSHRSI